MVRVHGHHVVGFGRPEDLLDFPDRTMPSDMDLHDIGMDDMIALPVQIILQPLDAPFIPRNDRGRKHDGVVLLQLDETMVVGHDARQDCIGFALCSGTNDDDLIVRILVNIVHSDERLRLRLEIPGVP